MIAEGAENEAVLAEAGLALGIIRGVLCMVPQPFAMASSAYMRIMGVASDLLTAPFT